MLFSTLLLLFCANMQATSNPFAALDSDDEAPKVTRAAASAADKSKKDAKPKAAAGGKAAAVKKADSSAKKVGGDSAGAIESSKEERHEKGDRKKNHGRSYKDAPKHHDKQSGSGRGKEIKKQGGGGHNWGTENDDQAGQQDEAVVEGEQPEDEQPEPEPEVVQLTYEEYQAKLAAEREGLEAAFGAVKVGRLDQVVLV
jgi:hypothetical protein